MLASTIYTFVHGKRSFTLYTFQNPEPYNATIKCYDHESDVYYGALIDSKLFINKTIGYIDSNIVDWFDNKSFNKKPSLSNYSIV